MHLKRIGSFGVLALLAAALPAAAGGHSAVPGPAAAAADHGHRGLLKCLTILDLTDAQKSQIKSLLEAEKSAMQAIRDKAKADRDALHAALSATSPDPCAVGAAAITLAGDRAALKAEVQKVVGEIGALLTPEQKAKYEGCVEHPAPAPGTADVLDDGDGAL